MFSWARMHRPWVKCVETTSLGTFPDKTALQFRQCHSRYIASNFTVIASIGNAVQFSSRRIDWLFKKSTCKHDLQITTYFWYFTNRTSSFKTMTPLSSLSAISKKYKNYFKKYLEMLYIFYFFFYLRFIWKLLLDWIALGIAALYSSLYCSWTSSLLFLD